ncbi:hypothetical protein EJ08DRAFT_156988 [Tothia fuscella]|uniref:G protein-coupled receptor GPR1/2/3 C-terminal domain-containing protein n=1 Tax=Tothia fuscella TaxID=1048955 RepID=A0A9P4U4H9_9PEZI|nr:hypothetical protein EJ08DRAFT_156988 [Tothia fuscella]
MPIHHATGDIFTSSLSPLPNSIAVGLIPVAALGILSFGAATGLLLLLTYRIIQWNRRQRHVNQFIVLIYNLLLADIQQSMAFMLNAQWLAQNGIEVGTRTCWAQGWFVSTGDMGSGVWAFAIGLHTFASVIFNYRLNNAAFLTVIVLLWAFIYGTAIAGVAIHPDLFVRAVAWCWVDAKYSRVRLWLHYFWIFTFEFGTVIVYSAMILAVRIRAQSNFYRSEERTRHAKDAAKLMVAYPLIYVLCTLPLATLRMYSIRNPQARVTAGWFCFAGAMITSNGWMDVLLYTLTRRIMLFSDESPTTDNGIESFGTPWSTQPMFGTETLCEYVPDTPRENGKGGFQKSGRDLFIMDDKPWHSTKKNGQLLAFASIGKEITVEVTSEPMTPQQKSVSQRIREGATVAGNHSREDDTNDEGSTKQLWSAGRSSDDAERVLTPLSEHHDIDSLEFRTKPAGF